MRHGMPWREYLDWLTYIQRKPLPAQRNEFLLGEILAAVRNQGAMGKPLTYSTDVPENRYVTIMDVVPWMRPPAPVLSEEEQVQADIEADKAKWRAAFPGMK